MFLKLIFLNTISLSQIHIEGTWLNPQTFQIMGMTIVNKVRYIISFFFISSIIHTQFLHHFLIEIFNFILSFNHVTVKF